MRWSEEQLRRYRINLDDDAGETESPLQSKIVQWAHDNGYPCHAHPQSRSYVKAHTRGEGWPDVTISLPGGRTVYLELKAKGGVMREGQIVMSLKMMQLKHEYYRVKTWKRFMEIVETSD